MSSGGSISSVTEMDALMISNVIFQGISLALAFTVGKIYHGIGAVRLKLEA